MDRIGYYTKIKFEEVYNLVSTGYFNESRELIESIGVYEFWSLYPHFLKDKFQSDMNIAFHHLLLIVGTCAK